MRFIMKAVILAGGKGTRLTEETTIRPKPMVEVGYKPILWHILKIYSTHGINDFIICCGYKGYMIKEYFANYFLHTSDITFDIKNNKIEVHNKNSEPWKVTLVDTGQNTMTGGRLARIKDFLTDEIFCFTYGDGLADINIKKLIEFHKKENRKATLTAVQPRGRFGSLQIESSMVTNFEEKPRGDKAWVNGGFFVLNRSVLDLIDGDKCIWEKQPLETLSNNNELSAFLHHGFWHPMDTIRDKIYLEGLWASNKAPWKKWIDT